MRVSIVVCNFNYGLYLDQAIRSAVAQTHPDVEIIVVDDGSTDDSHAVIDRWRSRVIAICKENGGQISAYNAGFERASGEVVIFLDADDFLYPDACRNVAGAFLAPDVAKVHYRLQLVGADGTQLGTTIPRGLDRGDLGKDLRGGRLYQSAPGSGNAYRRSVLARLMPLVADAEDRHGADFFAAYGVAMLGRVEAIEQPPLGGYRLQSEQARTRLSFGNADRRLPEPHRALRRYKRLDALLRERLGPGFGVPSDFADFSVDKLGFAHVIFSAPDYKAGVSAGASYFAGRLQRAIRARPGSTATKIGLVGWSLAVLVLPRRFGLPVARYVCNPASR
ncbi:MAG TPA: glycosyltransferase family 2 protein [Polyangiales bacterium]